nr:MAG TPA: hypothetical protein [Caudoviricetes sp.]
MSHLLIGIIPRYCYGSTVLNYTRISCTPCVV